MQIKRFEAPTMTEALRLIKKEFGPDAVILSARSLNQEKSLFGIKKPAGIEVTAATDTLNDTLENHAIETQAILAAAGSASGSLKGQNISIRIDDPISKKSLMNTIQTGLKSLSIRKNTQSVSAGMVKVVDRVKSHFALQGVEEIFIQALLEKFTGKSGSEIAWGSEAFKSRLLEVFSEMGISVGTPEKRGSRPQLHGFVGPAGGGKSSAVAKLTAIYAHQLKQKVGWITFDTKRVAAAAQLQVYGKILGVPLELVSGLREFREALKRFENMDHVFIDTPGMGIRDAQAIEEMSGILKQTHIDTVYLVAGAPTKNEDLNQMVKAYKSLYVTSLIVTKLDESQSYGNVFNLLMRSKLPVSYFISGQDIPYSIENASLEKVLELITDPGRESKPWHVPPGKTAEIIPYIKSNIQSPRFRDHYVANHKSVHFHSPECAWAKRIKPENRIVFASIEEAVLKKFTPCKTCSSDILRVQNTKETEVHQVGNGQPYYSR
jgi:flagellar biosynthesis protein FlhF